MDRTTAFARALRNNMTDAERLLWRHLRARQLEGARFRRQCPIGPYIADFVCLEHRLVVELDGGQHAMQSERDEQRDAWLARHGFRVRRFWNNQLFSETDAVLDSIRKALLDPAENI